MSKGKKILLGSFSLLALLLLVSAGLYFFGYIGSYLLNRGYINLYNGNLSAAETNFNIAKFLYPKDPRSYSGLGGVYLQRGQYELAEDYLIKSLDLGIKNQEKRIYGDAIYKLALVNDRLNKLEKAVDLYKEYISIREGEPLWSQYRLSYLYFEKLNKPDEAKKLIESLVRMNLDLNKGINKAEVYTLLGRIHLFSKEYDDSIGDFAIALKEGSIPPVIEQFIYLNLASAYSNKGDVNKAMEFIDKAAKIQVADSDFFTKCWQGSVYLNVNNSKKTIELIEPLFRGGNRDITCLNVLGRAFLAEGRKSEGKEILKEFLKQAEDLEYKPAFTHRRVEEVRSLFGEL